MAAFRKPAPEEPNLYALVGKRHTSAGGATSIRNRPSMPLLTELVASDITLAIKISLLRR